MSLFKRKKKKVEKKVAPAPSLPPLPKLPELPSLEEENKEDRSIHKLPSYPPGSLGTKFSQDTIKEAVSGREENFPEDEDEEIEGRPQKSVTEEIGWESPSKLRMRKESTGAGEPIFIRIDKFEEALKIFNETKKKLNEIERTLENIKSVKEKEEKELGSWENKVKTIKEQIEKVDKNVFSKI